MTTFNATLMGVSFTPAESKDYLDQCELGTQFRLVREPDNVWDMNAIRVERDSDDPFEKFKLGMVDRETAMTLAWYMDHGAEVTCTLVSKDPNKARKHALLIETADATAA